MTDSPVGAVLPGTDAHLFHAPYNRTYVRTSSGQFLHVPHAPHGMIDALLAIDGLDPHGSQYQPPHEGEATQVIQALREQITDTEATEAETRWESHRRTIVLLGEGSIINTLDQSLQTSGIKPHRYTSARDVKEQQILECIGSEASLVIAYADKPEQRQDWSYLDSLTTQGHAWLRAYREGLNCFVDPISLDATDPTSQQVLRRRIAASATPEPLTAWYKSHPESAALSETARVLVSARLLTIALAWGHGADSLAELRRTLWKFVPTTGELSEHTVLGYDNPYQPSPQGISR